MLLRQRVRVTHTRAYAYISLAVQVKVRRSAPERRSATSIFPEVRSEYIEDDDD